jgi:peptidoglycan/LPS O-acetylase OafA/YrhL
MVRSPTQYYVYFLCGYLLTPFRGRIMPHLVRKRSQVLAGSLAICLAYAAVHVAAPAFAMTWQSILRMAYTGAAVALIATVSTSGFASAAVRRLSDTSFTIYLYHLPFVMLLRPVMADAPAPVRVITLGVAGLFGALTIAEGVRRLAPHRSRWLVGS